MNENEINNNVEESKNVKVEENNNVGNNNKNKTIMVIVAIIAVILIVIAIVFTIGKKGNNVIFNLSELETKIDGMDMYGEMASQTIDKEILNTLFNISESEVEEVVGKMPLMNVHSSMYVIVKATDGNVKNVKQKIEDYGNKYSEQWERYLPDQYEYVKNRKIGTVGNYVYMIIGENSEEVEKLFK